MLRLSCGNNHTDAHQQVSSSLEGTTMKAKYMIESVSVLRLGVLVKWKDGTHTFIGNGEIERNESKERTS
jgi:hypothetical protein